MDPTEKNTSLSMLKESTRIQENFPAVPAEV
jgi:hypothetical protein